MTIEYITIGRDFKSIFTTLADDDETEVLVPGYRVTSGSSKDVDQVIEAQKKYNPDGPIFCYVWEYIEEDIHNIAVMASCYKVQDYIVNVR